MGIAHTARQGDRVALDDGVAVIERSEVSRHRSKHSRSAPDGVHCP